MDAAALRAQRIENFRDAVRMKKAPKRVPHISSYMTWKVVDTGYKFSEALNDWDLMEKIVYEFQERYQFDLMREWGSRNPLPVLQYFAKTKYIIDDENSYISALDFELMKEDEYDDYMNDYRRFLWTKLLPRRFPELKHTSKEAMRKTLAEYNKFMQYNQRVMKTLKEEYGIPDFAATGFSPSAHDIIMNRLRGIKGTSLDMRRHPEKIQEMVDRQNKNVTFPALERFKATKGDTPGYAFDAQSGCLSHTLLSIPQWEAYYWPGMKAILEAVVEADKTIYIFVQGSMKRFYDYFKDVPKGHVAIHLEQDDIFEARKRMPNICLAGGMPMTLLYDGTPQQCVDYAKRLVDEIGPNGGFILSQDKMGSFPKDTKRENLLAVCDFIQNYG